MGQEHRRSKGNFSSAFAGDIPKEKCAELLQMLENFEEKVRELEDKKRPALENADYGASLAFQLEIEQLRLKKVQERM